MNITPITLAYSGYNLKNINDKQYNTSFEGKTPKKPKEPSKLTQFIARTYGQKVLKSEKIRKFSDWLSRVDKTNATKHFAVAGSAVTSTAYAYHTVKNNKLEKKNSRTLATNQILGFLVPTALGYTIEKCISNYTKEYEYKFAAKLEKAMHHATLDSKAREEAVKRCTDQIKGVRTLAGIATFTLLYRYFAPVAITPLANKIGAGINAKKAKKDAEFCAKHPEKC